MNIVSNHNRLLRGAAIPTAGGDVYNSGWEYTPEGEISGYSGSAFYQQECPCDSAAIVDSAFNKSTAWVDEQNYLTEHQDVTNLPYVQNSALEFSPQGLISGISGSGIYATSAENAFTADTAYFAYNAEHADSADYAETTYSAQFANSASSALNAEVANVSYTALTAQFLDGGWEHDVDGFITAYNNSAFAGNGGGGRYEGISPIVVNNEEMRISAKSALLGVQGPLYFVEDSETATIIGISGGAGGIEYSGIAPIVVDNENHLISAESAKLGVQGPLYFVEDTPSSTVIGIYDSAISGRDWTDDITAASANALNEAINNITAVELANSALTAQTAINANHAASSDSATYDSLGRKIVETYLTAHQELPDWTPTIQNASGNAYNSAVNWVVDQHYLTGEVEYSAGQNIDISNHVVSGKDWSSEISDASANAVNEAINQITAVDYATSSNVANTALTANYVADGWEYNESNEITGYSGSAIHSEGGGQGIEYTGIAPIVVNNVEHKISAQSAKLGVQEPLYFVEDSVSATVIGISGLPEVEGVMYESALNFGNGYITGYNGSALSSERSRYAASSTSANGAVSSQTANYVVSGWEKSNNKITAYNGTAFSGGNPQVPVSGVGSVTITKPSDTVLISGKNFTPDIQNASSYAYNQATANAAGKYIPYTTITTGISGTTVYNVASGIRVTAASGWVELYNQNKENENEAHLQVGQNYTGNKSFWAELDGAGNGFLQMNWNSGTISPNQHSAYDYNTTASISLANGALVYRSAAHSLTATGGGDGENKVWQLGVKRLRFFDSVGNTAAEFGPDGWSCNHSSDYGFFRFDKDENGILQVGHSAGGYGQLGPTWLGFGVGTAWEDINIEKIRKWDSTTNTVSANSANWGGLSPTSAAKIIEMYNVITANSAKWLLNTDYSTGSI